MVAILLFHDVTVLEFVQKCNRYVVFSPPPEGEFTPELVPSLLTKNADDSKLGGHSRFASSYTLRVINFIGLFCCFFHETVCVRQRL